LQEADKLATEQKNNVNFLEGELEQMKITIEEYDTELKVKRCYGNGMWDLHLTIYGRPTDETELFLELRCGVDYSFHVY